MSIDCSKCTKFETIKKCHNGFQKEDCPLEKYEKERLMMSFFIIVAFSLFIGIALN